MVVLLQLFVDVVVIAVAMNVKLLFTVTIGFSRTVVIIIRFAIVILSTIVTAAPCFSNVCRGFFWKCFLVVVVVDAVVVVIVVVAAGAGTAAVVIVGVVALVLVLIPVLVDVTSAVIDVYELLLL